MRRISLPFVLSLVLSAVIPSASAAASLEDAGGVLQFPPMFFLFTESFGRPQANSGEPLPFSIHGKCGLYNQI